MKSEDDKLAEYCAEDVAWVWAVGDAIEDPKTDPMLLEALKRLKAAEESLETQRLEHERQMNEIRSIAAERGKFG
jgi:hypothetical protein